MLEVMCNVLVYRFISPYLSEGMSIYLTFSESITPRLISKYFIYIVLVCFKSKPFVRRGYLSGVTILQGVYLKKVVRLSSNLGFIFWIKQAYDFRAIY